MKTNWMILGAVVLGFTCGGFEVARAASPAPSPAATLATATPKSAAQTVADAVAPDAKSTVDEITKDFLIACEMSKVSINLAKTPVFKNHVADLTYRVSEMMSGAFHTREVKEAYKAIVTAKPEERVSLWHQAAKENGVKNFKCKTIGFK